MTQDEIDLKEYFETCIARWREIAETLPEKYDLEALNKLEESLKPNFKMLEHDFIYLQNWDIKCEQICIGNEQIGTEVLRFKKWSFNKNIILATRGADIIFDRCEFESVSINYISQNWKYFRPTIHLEFCLGNLKIISESTSLYLEINDEFDGFDLDLARAGNLNNCNPETRQKLNELKKIGKVKFESWQLETAELEETKKKNTKLKKTVQGNNAKIKFMKENPAIANYYNTQGDLVQGDKVMGSKIESQVNNPNLIQNILTWSGQNKYLAFGIFIFLLIFIYLIKDPIFNYFVAKK